MTLHRTLTRWTVAAILAMAAFACGPAAAEDFEIVVHHAEINDVRISPKVGDTLTFVNEAGIAHNLYVTYPDGTSVTLDTQPPGTRRSVTLTQSGPAVVRCWIHPIIRMDVTVGPAAE
ncbi:methylamine utilization protein MauL [Chthonobacter rhizosphaerae]|uniref:methylamine utilization protein MauL n=1 Tax=Chthonobacter rhizosphaerae TaxID=2735553 RepID=UPI0015EE4767|nr:methylamine utilization protein MauL [Chthonobacter rhizosphaerae]